MNGSIESTNRLTTKPSHKNAYNNDTLTVRQLPIFPTDYLMHRLKPVDTLHHASGTWSIFRVDWEEIESGGGGIASFFATVINGASTADW